VRLAWISAPASSWRCSRIRAMPTAGPRGPIQ
jgi:hypothetical protein